MAAQAPAQGGAQKAAPPAPQAFAVGVYATEYNGFDANVVMSTGTVNWPTYNVDPTGWLSGLWFLFECTTAANAAAVAFVNDGPFSAVAKITFKDVGGREIFGPIGGYDWLTIMKFGGYHQLGDPRSDPSFSTTTGAVGAGGSFTMVMYIPLEIVNRDALGNVENKSTSTTYRVEVVLDKAANVYSVAPTTLGTVRLRIILDGYTEPESTDAMGRPLASAPPAAGTIQYWATEPYVTGTGTTKYRSQNGLGYSIRNIIYKLVDGSTAAATPQGSRLQGDLDWPDPVTLTFSKIQFWQRYQKIWNTKVARDYGIFGSTKDASNGLENGVYPVWFTKDFGLKPGAELRQDYLATKVGQNLEWAGVINGSGAHTLNVLTNWVIPVGNDPARLRSSR